MQSDVNINKSRLAANYAPYDDQHFDTSTSGYRGSGSNIRYLDVRRPLRGVLLYINKPSVMGDSRSPTVSSRML